MPKLEFVEYMPDQPALDSPGSGLIYNAIPEIGNWYSPMRKPNALSSALPGMPIGSAVFRDNAGVVHVYAGTASDLYELVGQSWVSRSKAGGYSTTPGDTWEFMQFENQVIATNFTDPIQSAVHGTPFTDMGTNTPKAKHLWIVERFLMTGHVDDVDGVTPNRVRWSPIDNPFGDWTPSAITQSDFRNLRLGGVIQAGFGGDYGIIIQERSIQRISLVGGATVFRFDETEQGVGTNAPTSCVKQEGNIFFYATDGFRAIAGGRSQNIGEGKVNRTIKAILDEDRLHDFSVAVDPLKNVVQWKVPTVDGIPDRLVAYNWNNGRFTEGDASDVERLALSATASTTLEEIDAFFGVDIDTEPLASTTLDSPQFKGSTARLGCFDKQFQLCGFGGAAKSGIYQTAEAQLFDSEKAYLTGFKILVNDATDVRARVGTRNTQLKGAVNWTGWVSPNNEDICEFRSDAFYIRAEVRVDSDYSAAIGINIPSWEVSPSGER